VVYGGTNISTLFDDVWEFDTSKNSLYTTHDTHAFDAMLTDHCALTIVSPTVLATGQCSPGRCCTRGSDD
jgi:hypothetical protein